MNVPPLLEPTSPKLVALAAKLGREGIRPERPRKCVRRLRKDGVWQTFNISLPISDTQDWFWSMAYKNDAGCWLWMGSRRVKIEGRDYGCLEIDGKLVPTHRISAMFALGYMPPITEMLCHSCDVPPCMNPSHLFLGDNSSNIKDAYEKGRIKPYAPKGENNGRSKLKAWDVIAIRGSDEPRKKMAERFGVSLTSIYKIRAGLDWSHIP